MAWAEHLDWLLVGALFVLPLALWGLWQLVTRALEWWRDAAHVRAARILEASRHLDFADSDALIANLRGVGHLDAIDSAVNRELNFARGARRERLVKVSHNLGLVDRHLDRLSRADDWVQRAESAYSLGRHRLVEGIPLLVATLRDPTEVKNVKIASAQALLLMRTPTAVPVLVRQLVANDNWASPLIAEVLENIGPAAIPGMLEALGDESLAGARVWLTHILGQTGNPEVAENMVGHLKDQDAYLRVAVIAALGRLGQPACVGPLVDTALNDPMEHVRLEAARAAAAIAEHIAVPKLVAQLQHPDYAVRIRVIEAIEAVQPRDTTCLLSALDDASAEVRNRAARALEQLGFIEETVGRLASEEGASVQAARQDLERLGRADLAESLTPFLVHADWRVRYRVADLLGELGDVRVTDALEGALNDLHGTVRASAAQALAHLNPRDGVRRLAAALDDPDDVVRTIAAGALQALDPPTDAAGLGELLEVHDAARPELRRAIISTIGGLEGPEVAQRLEQALTDMDADVRLEAARHVADRATEEWFEALAQRLNDTDTRVRAAAARGLGRIGTAAALALLVRHIDTADRELREALSDALVSFGPRAFARLVDRSENPERKLALIWTLGKMGSPAAAVRLEALAEEPDAEMRAAVAGALGRHTEVAAAETVLARLLIDPNERVRAAAANALGRRHPTPGLARMLAEALRDPDSYVRARVALALGQMGGDLATEALQRALHRAENAVERAHVVIGLVLTGNHAGLAAGLRTLEDQKVESDVRATLAKEPDELRERFRRSLRLEIGGESLPGTGLTAGDLPENYVHTLQHSRWIAARSSAISALRSLGAAPHRDLILRALRSDPAPEVRLMALEALGDLTADPDLPDWLGEALYDRDLHVKIAAAGRLSGRCRAQHFEALLRGFESRSSELDEAVIRTLASVMDDQIPELVKVMARLREPTIQAGAAVTLAAIGDSRAVPLLAAWLRSPHDEVRSEASRTLAELPSPEARHALVRSLDEAKAPTIMTILDALPNLMDLESLDPLTILCEHPSKAVRSALSRLAGRGPYPTGVEITERLCWDDSEDVRVQALLSLVFVRDPEALERFTVILRRQPKPIRLALRRQPSLRLAVMALRTMAGSHRDKAVRAAAIGALGAVGDRHRKLLVRALNDPAREVRVAAAEALGDLDVPEVREALQRLRDDPNEAVQEAARTQRIRVPNPRHTPAPGWEIIRLPSRSRRKRRSRETTWT